LNLDQLFMKVMVSLTYRNTFLNLWRKSVLCALTSDQWRLNVVGHMSSKGAWYIISGGNLANVKR
jgi:hypothetical protein